MFFEGLLLLNFKSLILVEIKQLFVLFNVLWKKKTFRTLFFFYEVALTDKVNVISTSATWSWVNIFVDPGTFQSTNQIWGTSLQFMSSLGLQLGASTSVLTGT